MKFIRALTLAVVCQFVFSFYAYAQRPINFEHISIEDGLSQSSVISITQDDKGFMWFGCRYGLNRYDGKNFKVYRHNPKDTNSISSEYYLLVHRGNDKKIWLITQFGLDAYNDKLDNFNRVLVSNEIKSFLQDYSGRIWVGTKNGLLLSESPKKNNFKPFYLNKDNKLIVNVLFEGQDKRIWVGTNKGLFLIHNNKVFSYQDISINNISSIIQDKYGHLWIGTIGKGLFVLNLSNNKIKNLRQEIGVKASLASNDVFKIIAAKNGLIWVGTQTGLSIINAQNYKVDTYRNNPSDRNSLSQNSLYDVFEDQRGSIWIGSYFGGINVVHETTKPFKVYSADDNSNSLSVNVISALYRDSYKNLWVGTENWGLNYLDSDFKKIKSYKTIPGQPNSLSSNHVKGVLKDDKGRVWIATHKGGLNVLDTRTNTFKAFKNNPDDSTSLESNNIYCILFDSKKRFWIGTEYGLSLFNPMTGTFKRSNVITKEFGIKGGYAMNIFEDSKNNLFVSNYLGVHILRSGEKKFKLIPDLSQTDLHSDRINYIFEDSKNRLWIANNQAGITFLDYKNLKFKIYNKSHGLPNNNIVGILEDDKGFLWLSTENGLSKFDVDKELFHNYDQKDGLPSNEFNRASCLKLEDGTLLFGSYKGLVSFKPEDIRVNLYAPKVWLTDLKLFNKSVKVNGEDGLLTENISLTNNITFAHDQNSFTLEFAALNYIQSDKNRYAYKLEGFDKDWNYGTVAFATYANLLPGKYKFLVKAANNNGVWSSSVRELQIQVLSPPWKSFWAYLIYSLILCIVVFLIVRYVRIRVRLRREEEIHQLKLDFFTNISHEIRTPLTLIKAPIEELITNPNQDKQQKESLMQVKNNADRLLRLVTELMDFRKAETGKLDLEVQEHNLIDFLNDIYNSFSILARKKAISYSFKHEEAVLNVYFDKNQLEKVFFNLLSNAFKFTPDGGEITISIKDDDGLCMIEVADNGCGIAEDDHKNLFRKFFQSKLKQVEMPGSGIGLALSKSILELHKGSISFKSRLAQNGENGYTIFQVELLKGDKHFHQDSLKPSSKNENFRLVNDFDIISEDVIALDEETQNAQILVIEDNDEIREFIKSSLVRNYTIETAENGTIGLEKAFENLPDLIISDVKMPGKDGLEICRILKSDERTSHIPIILLTARTTLVHQLSGLENGADIYLTKPFSLYMLKLNIRNLLAGRKAMRERFSQEMTLEPTKIIINPADEKFLKRIMQIIEDHIDDSEFDVDQLINEVGMSRRVLYKKLSSLTNMTAADFVRSVRLKKAALLLENGGFNVSEVAFAVGFNDPKYFTKSFKKQFGKSPRDYQNSLSSS